MANKAPHLLDKLSLEEISIVDAGANKGARVILLKSESDIMENKERNQIVATLVKYLNADITDIVSMLKADNINHEDTHVSNELEQLQKDSKSQGILILKLAAQNAFGTMLAVVKDAIAKAADATGVDAILTKAKTDLVDLIKAGKVHDQAELIKQFEASLDGDLTERAKARKAELEKSTSKAEMTKFRDKLPGALQKAFDDMDEDERAAFMTKFSKSDENDPITKLSKALEDSSTENATLKKRLDAMEADTEITKAEKEFESLAKYVNLKEFIPNVIKMRKLDKDAAEAFVTQTKAMAAQMADANIFSIFGKNGEGDSGAEAKLEKLAKKYRAEHSDCASDEIAMAKVLDDPANADLYSQYNAEQEEAG